MTTSKKLAAEVVDDPEDEAEDDADKERGHQGDGDAPVAASPGEIAGEAPQRDVEASEDDNDETDGNQKNAEGDQDASEIRHQLDVLRLCTGQYGVDLAEKFGGLAGFGENCRRARQVAGVVLDVLGCGPGAGEDEDLAGRMLAGDVANEREAVGSWQGDVAEQQVGAKAASAGDRGLGGVAGTGVEAGFAEDEGEGIGDKVVIIDDENATRYASFRHTHCLGRHIVP
jgi:hypothetical protein